jgi:hypothetical protein
MFWKKKKKDLLQIPTAKELRVILDNNLRLDLERKAQLIARHFLGGGHPYHNFDAMFGFAICNHLIDKLKPELEALGYEVIIKFSVDMKSDLKIEYREVRIKE